MLIDKTGSVVDLVVDNEEEVLLGSVLRDLRVGIFLVGHCCGGAS